MLAKLRKPVDKEEWVIFLHYLKPFVILLMYCSINSKSLSLAAENSNCLGWFNSVAAPFSGEGILKQVKRFAIFNLRSYISIGHHFGKNRIWSQRCGASMIPLENCIWAITDRAIFVWPWNENVRTKQKQQTKEIERFDWFIERIQTRVAFGWLSERSGENTSCPRTF